MVYATELNVKRDKHECTCAAKTYKTVTSYEAWNNEEKLVLKL